MATIYTITIGSVDYLSYALDPDRAPNPDPLQDAEDYLAAHVNAAEWAAATTLQKQQALVTAFRMIERETWSGTAVGASAWPRTGAICNGTAYPDDGTVPDVIAQGQYELALYLLKDASILEKSSQASNIKAVGAGSAKVEFFYGVAPGSSITKWPLPAHELMACYLSGGGVSTDVLGPFVGEASDPFFSADDSDRSEGFA